MSKPNRSSNPPALAAEPAAATAVAAPPSDPPREPDPWAGIADGVDAGDSVQWALSPAGPWTGAYVSRKHADESLGLYVFNYGFGATQKDSVYGLGDPRLANPDLGPKNNGCWRRRPTDIARDQAIADLAAEIAELKKQLT